MSQVQGRRVVIAGGSGLVGRGLVARLLEEGAHVSVLSRNPDTHLQGTETVTWDPTATPGKWAAALAGATAVVNLAGAGIGDRRWTAARKRVLLDSRLQATNAIVNAIGTLPVADRPPVLVNSSGIDYAGDSGDRLVDETVAPGDSFLAGVCREWEAAAERATVHGTRVVRVRTSLVIAHDARAFQLLVLPFRLFAGGPLGSGRQWFPWIHVADLAALMVRAMDDPGVSGPVNAVAPNVVRQGDAARVVGRAMHRPAVMPAPALALRALLGEMADVLLHGQRATPTVLDGFRFLHPSLDGAVREALGQPG